MRLKGIIILPKTFDLSLNMYECSKREQEIRVTESPELRVALFRIALMRPKCWHS